MILVATRRTATRFLILTIFLCLLAAASILIFSKPAPASARNNPPKAEYRTDQLLIKFRSHARAVVSQKPGKTTGIPSVDTTVGKRALKHFEKLAKPGKKSKQTSEVFAWYTLTLDETVLHEKIVKNGEVVDLTLERLKASLLQDPNIESVEQNFIVQTSVIPNDPFYGTTGSWGQAFRDTWGLNTINAESAWDSTTGNASLVVANIDTGLYMSHPDIASNVWSNTNETPANGIDDDANGYVDDVNGWNWVSNNANVNDNNGHGTHTAGTLAAVGNNNIGITGVAWSAKIMPLKFLNQSGNGTVDNGAKALVYAADMGARISSNSWGCTCNSQLLEDAVRYEHERNMITVVAAGNNYAANALDYAPADSDGAITVGATDSNNQIANFSNIGSRIDVVAPGVDILSLRSALSPGCNSSNVVSSEYCRMSGTSMATPHVSGLAALMVSHSPSLTNEQVRQILRTNSTDIGQVGRDNTFGFGLIEAAKSVSTNIVPPTVYLSGPGSRSLLTSPTNITGTVSGDNFQSYKIEIGLGRSPANLTTIASGTTRIENGVLASLDPTTLADGTYTIRATVTDTAGKTFVHELYDIQVDNVVSEILSPQNIVSLGQNTITGTIAAKNGLSIASYTLEYGNGSTPTSFSQTGITTTAATSITQDTLGTWNTAALNDGQTYTLRLTVTLTNGVKSSSTQKLVADKTLVEGWPKYLPSTECDSNCGGTPAFVDLDKNGSQETVIATPGSNTITAYSRNGSTVNGFPVTVASGDWFKWPISSADIDGDGNPELIAAAVTSSNTTRVYVINHDGTQRAGWPQPEYRSALGANTDNISPAVADLDGDGQKELVTVEIYWPQSGSVVHRMHAVRLDGSELSGFPKDIPVQNSFLQSAVTIADLDKDGQPEIGFGNYDKFYLFDNQGNLLPGWPYVAPPINGQIETFQSTPAVGDIDGDGMLEIFATATPNGALGIQLPVYGWKKDGTILPGWPQMTGTYGSYHVGWPLNTPATADINNDGKDEVIVGFNNVTIHTLTGKLPMNPAVGSGSISLGDVTADGFPEISAGRRSGDDGIQLLRSDGSTHWENNNLMNVSLYNPVTLSDIDNNGLLEYAGVLSLTNSRGSLAYMWEMPGTASKPLDNWSMFGHDAANTNHYTIGSLSFSDTVAPATSLTAPTNGATVANDVTISANATDNIGVTKVEFYINGSLVGTDTTAPYSHPWNSKTGANGTYTITAKAYDAADNSTVSTPVSVNVANADSTPPTVSITSPASGSTVFGTVSITANAADNIGVTRVEFYANGVLLGSDSSAPYTHSWNSLTVSNGSYTIQTRAYDAANLSASNSVSVTVSNPDSTPPTVSITSPANGAFLTKNTTVTILAAAADNNSVTKVEFYVDNVLKCTDTTSTYSCNYKLSSKAGVSYTIIAKAYDARGNTTSTSIRVTTK